MLEELMFVVERVTEEPGGKKDMNLMLAAFSSKIERLVLLEKLDRPKQGKEESDRRPEKQRQKIKTLHAESQEQESRDDD